MRLIISIFLIFIFHKVSAQRIADSLSFENMNSYFKNQNNFFVYHSIEDSLWYLYETKNGSGPFADDLIKKPIKNGDYFEFSENKNIVIYGNYDNDKEEALFIYFDASGGIKRTTHFKNGKLNGQSKNYYLNGQLRLSQDYKNGMKHGEILGFYMDGTRLFTGKYKKNKMIGQRMYFDVKGRPANGEMTWRHENGAIKLTGKCVNGMPDGRFTHYDENGIVMLQVDYTRGLPDGAFIKYKNGEVEYKDCYVLGKYRIRGCW